MAKYKMVVVEIKMESGLDGAGKSWWKDVLETRLNTMPLKYKVLKYYE